MLRLSQYKELRKLSGLIDPTCEEDCRRVNEIENCLPEDRYILEESAEINNYIMASSFPYTLNGETAKKKNVFPGFKRRKMNESDVVDALDDKERLQLAAENMLDFLVSRNLLGDFREWESKQRGVPGW